MNEDKLKLRASSAAQTVDAKLLSLSCLAGEFLEKTFDDKSLVCNWAEMERLKTILLKHLFKGNINPDEPDWCPETADEFAQMILFFHVRLTEGFWNGFKRELKYRLEMMGPTIVPPELAEYECLVGYEPNNLDSFIKINIPDTNMIVRCSFEGNNLNFFRSTVDAIPALLDLLQGVPLDRLHFCENQACGSFIVQTTGHERRYCSARCQSVQYQRELRQKNPDIHKEYHRDYYHLIKQRKKRERGHIQ